MFAEKGDNWSLKLRFDDWTNLTMLLKAVAAIIVESKSESELWKFIFLFLNVVKLLLLFQVLKIQNDPGAGGGP